MSNLGPITIPAFAPTLEFPLTRLEYGFGVSQQPQIASHEFAVANRKVSQRFVIGTGAHKFSIGCSRLTAAERDSLLTFWEDLGGAWRPFYFDAPAEDGTTTRITCVFEQPALTFEALNDCLVSCSLVLVEVPETVPEYSISATLNRFPSSALNDKLLDQVQQIIPLIKIVPVANQSDPIYVSDRKVTVGGITYEPRLLDWDGIAQSIGDLGSDEANFVLGNADRVFSQLVNAVDLFKARLEFSLFHVATTTKLDLWAGDVNDWSADAGPEFRITASDGLYELRLGYPERRVSRTCWKTPGSSCPLAAGTPCKRTWDACVAHGLQDSFGGILAKPQSVHIKDNSTGRWGIGRDSITSRSLISDSVFGAPLPEIYTTPSYKTVVKSQQIEHVDPDTGEITYTWEDVEEIVPSDFPVDCLLAAGRDESDFYCALGVVGRGPIAAFGEGHTVDNQPHHGPNDMGLRTSVGDDPNADSFSLSETDNPPGPERAAGTAFIEIRRNDDKGLQLSKLTEHTMRAMIRSGLKGWVWTAPGQRSLQVLSNPVWIAVNMLLRARRVFDSDANVQEALFDVPAAIAAAGVCDHEVAKMVGEGVEKQYSFRGVLKDEKPLRDWMTEVLNTCLGYYIFNCGKLKIGLRADSAVKSAFTAGNIVADSLRLAPIKPSFNHITVEFGNSDLDFANDAVTYFDADHIARIGTKLESKINLVGCSTRSHAARFAVTRVREELGGVSADEWAAARQVAFKTTVLALETEPGMICSLDHDEMPGGRGEFRILRWRLNKDYSIEIEGRTTTDAIYNLLAGVDLSDILPDPIPVEESSPVPGDVQGFTVQASVVADSNGVKQTALDIEYTPPAPIGSFTGVGASVQFPTGKVTDQKYFAFTPGAAGKGHCRLLLPPPVEIESWLLRLASTSNVLRKPIDDTTPSRVVEVEPVDPIDGATPMPLAGAVQGVTATVRYGVFEERDGTRKLKVQVSGAVTPPAGDQYFLCARLTITLDGETIDLGYSGGDHTFVADWVEIPEGNYTLRAYSVNLENVETPEYFEAAEPLVIDTMPAALPITNPQFSVDEQIVEDPKTGALKHEWRLTGSFTQEPSEYHWYAWVKLRPIAGADTRPIVPLLQVGEPERSFVSGWFPMGAETTYQVEYSGVNRLEIERDPVVAGTFTVGPMGASGNVNAFNAGTLNEDTGEWTAAMSWDPLKQFMLIDYGCLLPQSTSNWSGLAVFIKIPNASTPGGFDYVQATGVMDKSMFTPSAAGPLAFYDRIAIGLKDVPDPPQQWGFIACSYDREGNPRHDGDGKPTGPTVTLMTLPPPVKPITPDGKVNPDTLNRKLVLGDLDNANINIEDFAGQLHIARIANLGEFNIGSFSGNLGVNRIDNLGSFNIENFTGNLPISRITNLESINISTFQGNLDVGRVANLGSFDIGNFQGVITTQQVQDGFLADLNKFAQELRPIARVASRGAVPGPGFPEGSIVLDATDSRLYKSVGGAWQPVSASEAVSGKISASDILSVNASTINGQINAGVITHVQVSQFAGTLSAAQCQSIAISSFWGNLDVSRIQNINTLNIANLQGNLDASRVANIGSIQIGSLGGNLDVSRVANIGNLSITTFSGTIANLNVNTLTLTGQWADGHIAGIAAGKIAAGTIDVTGTGMTFSGSGGIVLMNGGSIYVSPGKVTASSFEAMSVAQGWTITGGIVPSISANVNTASITASLFKHYTAGNGGTYTISIKGSDGYWHNFAFNGGILTAYQAIAQ